MGETTADGGLLLLSTASPVGVGVANVGGPFFFRGGCDGFGPEGDGAAAFTPLACAEVEEGGKEE